MDPGDLILVGRITRPWGLKGGVRVQPESDIPDRFRSLESVWVTAGRGEPRQYRIEWVKDIKGGVAIGLEGVGTPEDAERFRDCEVSIPEAERAPLEEDAYYIHDLVGLQARAPDGSPVGTLAGIIQGSAQDILRFETPSGDVLVPAVKTYVKSVDLEAGVVVVELPVTDEGG